MKKNMHNTYIQYIRSVIHHKFTSDMHSLKTNFDKFFNITKSVFKDRLNESNNFYFYPNKPKLSDCEIIALSVTGESISIDSENYFWGRLKSDNKYDSPTLIHQTNFNRRRKRLHPFIEQLNQCLSGWLNEFKNIYLVELISIPVYQIASEKWCKICKESFDTSPDKGYSAVSRSYYCGSKLHPVTSVRGIFHSMDLTKASVHYVHYLSETKRSGLSMCTLIANKGYLSSNYQLDLFNSNYESLETPKKQIRKDNHFP